LARSKNFVRIAQLKKKHASMANETGEREESKGKG